jgi:hypothetical protein
MNKTAANHKVAEFGDEMCLLSRHPRMFSSGVQSDLDSRLKHARMTETDRQIDLLGCRAMSF